MSSIPKARKSTINNITVTPDNWDSYPEVERCTINTSRFEHLSSDTHITRSTLNDVTLRTGSRTGGDYEETYRHNDISHCHLTGCAVAGASISRSELTDAEIADAEHNMDKVEAQNARFLRPGRIAKSTVKSSLVCGESDVEKSTVKRSAITDSSRIERSQVDEVVMAGSRVSRSVLKECEVMGCEISKTNFTGKTLKYGIWENGDLIGRTSDAHEVVIVQTPPGGTGSQLEKASDNLQTMQSASDAQSQSQSQSPSDEASQGVTTKGTDEQPPPYEYYR